MFLRLILIVALACMGACQTPMFTYEPVSNPDNGMLYIYRPKASNPGAQPLRAKYPAMLIDGVSKGGLKFNSYLAIELPQGAHKILATGLTPGSNWSEPDREVNVNIARGKNQFVKLSVQFDLQQMQVFNPGNKYIIRLAPVAENTAVYEIRETSKTR
ncbi:MAG: hypothetical protein O3A63_00135 [Proteobacteria bacterium]|nr:hypothetical protein [Pseudomonadota bacterium]